MRFILPLALLALIIPSTAVADDLESVTINLQFPTAPSSSYNSVTATLPAGIKTRNIISFSTQFIEPLFPTAPNTVRPASLHGCSEEFIGYNNGELNAVLVSCYSSQALSSNYPVPNSGDLVTLKILYKR